MEKDKQQPGWWLIVVILIFIILGFLASNVLKKYRII